MERIWNLWRKYIVDVKSIHEFSGIFVSKLQQLAGSRCFFSWYPTQSCWSISISCCHFWFRKTSQQLFKGDPLGLLLFLLKGASCICFSSRDLFKSHPLRQLSLPLVTSLPGKLPLPLKYDEFTPGHKGSCPWQQDVSVLLPATAGWNACERRGGAAPVCSSSPACAPSSESTPSWGDKEHGAVSVGHRSRLSLGTSQTLSTHWLHTQG